MQKNIERNHEKIIFRTSNACWMSHFSHQSSKPAYYRCRLTDFRACFDQTILCYVPSGHFMISYDIQTTEFNCYLSPSHVNKGTRLLSPPDQIEKKNVHLALIHSKGTTKNIYKC